MFHNKVSRDANRLSICFFKKSDTVSLLVDDVCNYADLVRLGKKLVDKATRMKMVSGF